MKKKCGIVVDAYKVKHFLQELKKIGYSEVKQQTFKVKEKLELLTFEYENKPEVFDEIQTTLKNCEIYFAGMKN